MSAGKSKRKNKFKLNERSSSSVRDKYFDPAFTEDVRHLAMPLRRNSGPESEFARINAKKKSKTSKIDDKLERKRKTNKSAEFLNQDTSSSESLDNLISSDKSKGKKGSSLDRNIQSFDVETKSQVKPKRSSWFLRDRSREKQQAKNEKFFKRSSLDFTSSTSFDLKLSRKTRPIQRQNATEYTGDSSTTTQNEEFMDSKTSGLSKFQLGKRLLKGEIGIRSFNYYLLKEGLRKRESKQEAPPKSRSEENIYEEIYFRHDLPTPKPLSPPELPPMNKIVNSSSQQKLEENCANCEICLQEAAQNSLTDREHLMMSSDGYTRLDLNNSENLTSSSRQDYFQLHPMLQFQSYNPNYPNVYKIESTPLVSIDFNNQQQKSEESMRHEQMQSDYQSFRSKSSIVTKSIRAAKTTNTMSNEFYTRPNYIYPSQSTSNNNIKSTRLEVDDVKQRNKDSCVNSGKIFKVNSSNSVRSGGENETIYNGSQKSNQSNKSSVSIHDAQLQMSDSSIGDSLFSSDPNKRGFGSSESCRFNYENRVGGEEENEEKCSFSDTCNLRNCDCSSSYFSSDFDDNNIYNHHINSNPEDYYEHQRTNLCAEDSKKLNKNKRQQQNQHYEVPKRIDADKNVDKKLSTNKFKTKSAAMTEKKASSSSTDPIKKKKNLTTIVDPQKRAAKNIETTLPKAKNDEKLVVKNDEKILSKIEYKMNKKDVGIVDKNTQNFKNNAQPAEMEDDEVFLDTINVEKDPPQVDKEKKILEEDTTQNLKLKVVEKASPLKAPTSNNNKASSDDDDSVFLNENKTSKLPATTLNVSSSMLKNDGANVSSSLNVKTSNDPKATQNHKLVSCETDLQSETLRRDQQDQKNINQDDKKKLKETNDQIDFSKIPLPDIPNSNKKSQLNKGKSLSKDNITTTTSTSSKIQAKWKQLTEKEYFKKMHYRNSSVEKKTPTYLFGENKPQKNGIFLNRSGWLQTSNPQRYNNDSTESRKENIKQLKNANSKLEELISRSESRKLTNQQNLKEENVTILKIDSKTEIASAAAKKVVNDRPGFLPVKSNLLKQGPPPTPILSPPPAFQDGNIRNRIIEMNKATRIQLSTHIENDNNKVENPLNNVGKGMAFSRSFEYDNRKTQEFNENFSKSFDFDFQLNDKSVPCDTFLTRFEKVNKFSNLTGISPNYLTKPQKPMESIFPKVIPGNNLKISNPNYYNPNYEDRRSQFSQAANNFRSFESNKLSLINNRLNSCDSGARSDFSNDDLDEDPNDDDDPSSSLALSYKSSATAASYQSRSQYQNSRSITPETNFNDHDLLTVNRSNSMKKQRSLTPDKRPITPEFNKSIPTKLTTSQTSLMSRQSSGSRQSTLERQLKRHEESRISRSSSSSSESGGVINRQSRRPPFKSNFGDYKIRRSRSLQLSERSPSRAQLQKVVVRIGNTQAPQSTNTTLTRHREKLADYGQIRNKTTLTLPSSKYYDDNGYSSSLRNSDMSLTHKKTKSQEILDFNSNAYTSSGVGFDSDAKSKSFDDDFCYNTQATRSQSNSRNVFSGNRAFSQDRVLLVPSNQLQVKSLRSSPNRNYGSRLHDHESLYDIANSRRSPVMNYNNSMLSREKSPMSRRSRDMERESHKKSNLNYLKSRTSLTPDRSPNRSPTDSDDSINGQHVLKDKSLVTEYLIGLKRKQLAKQNRATASSGSSTSSSSCESWPPPPKSHHTVNSQIHSVVAASSIKRNSTKGRSSDKSYVNLMSDSSGNSVKIHVNMQEHKQQLVSNETSTTVTINGMQAGRVNKLNNSSIIFLGDCEMPITKSVNSVKTSGSDSGVGSGKNFTQKIQIKGTTTASSNVKVSSSISQQKSRMMSKDSKQKFFTSSNSTSDMPIKRRHFTRLQSRSLPKSFMRMRCRNLSTEANEFAAMFPPQTPLQIRAVSSPSLTENLTETTSNKNSNFSNKPEPNSSSNNNHTELNDRAQPQNVSSGSVLQKFRKTFFKNGKGNSTLIDESNETKHHRFGPLVWRSSKERRKTKTHRRDKCNSGDSGIQVELDNEENLSENVSIQQNMDISPPHNVKVRRANSAKVPNSTVKSLSHKNSEQASSSISTKRSLSQPSDLDAIVTDKMMHNLDNIRHIDEADTDTDSIASNHLEDIDDDGHNIVYAEVLYSFEAGGPNELSLEKGTLVQVLKRDDGPWWWGRIKVDDCVSVEETDGQSQGWFPKDFVKLIPGFASSVRSKFKNQISYEFDCDNHLASLLPPTSAAPSISSSQSSSEVMRDNVIKELLETEINYVKLLNSLVEGFMKEMKSHPEVFSIETMFLIFSNIDQIYRFQQSFLEALRIAIPNNRIAETFLEFQSSFMVYSQYCNTYPRALVELEHISNNKEANRILESCRIAQSLPELPLSAHLLAPIQRICRYPLHLSELVKHSKQRKEIIPKLDTQHMTKADLERIDTKELFEVALNAMRRVTELVNEGKRHSEYLSRIQDRIESFQGPSINVHSTRLFLQTDAVRVSPNLWNNTYTLFLFDRQLIYCKKDLLKRTSYIYKGRIFLDNCRILNLPDGKMFGVTLKNALRMYCETRGKWFDFCFRSSSSKIRFLNTLAAERQFCGGNLFVTELASRLEDEELSDDVNTLSQDYDERGIDVEPTNSNGQLESPTKQHKYSETLPKKPRKLSKDVPSQIIIDYNPAPTTSSNGNKRRLGNWFRKSKSTNSTPSQSPTHHPLTSTSTVPSIVNQSDSNSSSQSSPVNYPRHENFKDGGGNSST